MTRRVVPIPHAGTPWPSATLPSPKRGPRLPNYETRSTRLETDPTYRQGITWGRDTQDGASRRPFRTRWIRRSDRVNSAINRPIADSRRTTDKVDFRLIDCKRPRAPRKGPARARASPSGASGGAACCGTGCSRSRPSRPRSRLLPPRSRDHRAGSWPAPASSRSTRS